MRQLKAFLKAKKPMWNCGKCECLTLKCWRENDEFCNCGENVIPPVPPVPPTPTTHTVTFAVNPVDGGSVDVQSIEVEDGTAITRGETTLTIGETVVNETPADGYIFINWYCNGTELPATVTEDITIEAAFEYYSPTETISAPSINSVQVTEGAESYDVHFSYTPEDATDLSEVISCGGSDDSIAYAEVNDFTQGDAIVTIYGVSEGTCTVDYSFGGTSYSIDVEVVPGL